MDVIQFHLDLDRPIGHLSDRVPECNTVCYHIKNNYYTKQTNGLRGSEEDCFR
jgi:hypothetical protein